MSAQSAGSTINKLLSRQDRLAPLPVPTGQKAVDMMNIIWRKNDIFLDVGNYSIGAGVMILWSMLLLMFGLAFWFEYLMPGKNLIEFVGAGIITGIPALFLIYKLFQSVSLPIRFNRQRREVCVPRENGHYWIVPWETVIAVSTQHTSVSQAGKNTAGQLLIGFDNPDTPVGDDEKHFFWAFNCGGGVAAMALWECVRSYMEVGPHAVPETRLGEAPYEETQIGSVVTSLRKGDILGVLSGLFFITVFGTYFAEKLQNLKLSVPPDILNVDIIEWSKPLPPEQWAKRSPELERAIIQREAELAARPGS